MKSTLSFHDIDAVSRPRLREIFEHRAQQLEKQRLSSFQPDLVRLEGRLEKSPKHHLYRVALRLRLPSGVLTTMAESHDLVAGLKEAFDELDRRGERHVARLQRAHLWKRAARRMKLEQLKHGERTGRERAQRRMLYELIEPHLDALYGYVRRELLYRGPASDPRATEVEAADVVAGTLLRALDRLDDRPLEINIRDWLVSLAHEELDAAAEAMRPAQSLSAPPDTGSEDPTRRDEERYEYWEPDECLRLEDLLPDPAADTPEEAAIQRDVRRTLLRALSALPHRWRQAVILTTFEGLTASQAGVVLGEPEARIETMLAHAEAFLKQRLADAGFAYEPGGSDAAAVAAVGRTPFPPADRVEIIEALRS